VTITPVNDTPNITGGSATTPEDTPVTIVFGDLTVTDPDNTYSTGFTLNVLPGTGYTVDGNEITPSVPEFSGNLTVNVNVDDGGTNGTSASYPLSVTVTNVDDKPIITGQSGAITTSEDLGSPVTITLANLLVTDPDNTYPDDFTLTVIDGVNYSISWNDVTPDQNIIGPLLVTVKVNDGNSDSDNYNITITVAPVNDAPVNTTTPDFTPDVLRIGGSIEANKGTWNDNSDN
jgi:hypothetical protein